ncbi:MAG: GreA/GreB family elongation factor [Bacilli bacterium]|nr:GreA/GreB family elongation factor [Bacilli bacterium]
MKLTEGSFEILKKRLAKAMDDDSEIIVEIEEARKQGDLSENADYSAAMEKKRSNDALIRDLRKQVESAEVVGNPTDNSVVAINTVVKVLKMKNNMIKTYQIGDSINTDPDVGIISEHSPLGQALSGHKKGDVVNIQCRVPYNVKILDIKTIE